MDEAQDENTISPQAADAAIAAHLAWRSFAEASTPTSQASALLELNEAMSDLTSWLPGYDYETGTIAAERDEL